MKVLIPSPLRPYTEQRMVEAAGATLAELLSDLDEKYPGIRFRMIDEQDEVYDQLKLWTWNESGEQELLSLTQADVGAIYLGAVEAEFSHMNDHNQLLAQQRSQSIYLKNSGEVGSARQVDVVL